MLLKNYSGPGRRRAEFFSSIDPERAGTGTGWASCVTPSNPGELPIQLQEGFVPLGELRADNRADARVRDYRLASYSVGKTA